MDTVDRATRSRIMARVAQKDTGPEIVLRSALHKSGLRYRLHDKGLPGRPDLVFRRFRAVIFVNGCFWHAHGCAKSSIPRTRRAYWLGKFATNKARDRRNVASLQNQDWRVLVIWECALVGKYAKPCAEIVSQCHDWLTGKVAVEEISGTSVK